MYIKGIDCQIPSNKILNGEILELVEFYSKPYFKGDSMNDLLQEISIYLNSINIKSRYWRKSSENPMNLIKKSVETALNNAKLQKKDIDLVIFCSIDRGYMEPANATLVANLLGMEKVRSFDITDACMGWCTATQIAQSMLKNEVEHILIISSECPMDNNGSILPNNFKIKSKEELEWKIPSFTIGEAVSATILGKGKGKCEYRFLENPKYSDLCSIPIHNPPKFGIKSQKSEGKIPLQFYAYGSDMAMKGVRNAIRIFNEFKTENNYEPDIIFPHSISKKIIDYTSEKAKVKGQICSTFSTLGNLATSSIPSAIVKAKKTGLINKKSKMLGWIGSAGLKFSVFEIKL
jgi:3-oxoacyl-[acyl-carrier-protein] synthase III